jgi:putative ABC transport system substrate-binding protein
VLIDMKPSLGTPLMGETFVGYMKGLGWEDGRHYRALFMWTEGHADRIPGLVNELVAKMVTVIVVFGNTAIDAAQRATTTIPIVCMADDMIKSGLAATMARPGSNTTGVSILASELECEAA